MALPELMHLKTNLRNHDNTTQLVNPNSSFLFLTTAVATNRDRGTVRGRRSGIPGLSQDDDQFHDPCQRTSLLWWISMGILMKNHRLTLVKRQRFIGHVVLHWMESFTFLVDSMKNARYIFCQSTALVYPSKNGPFWYFSSDSKPHGWCQNGQR